MMKKFMPLVLSLTLAGTAFAGSSSRPIEVSGKEQSLGIITPDVATGSMVLAANEYIRSPDGRYLGCPATLEWKGNGRGYFCGEQNDKWSDVRSMLPTGTGYVGYRIHVTESHGNRLEIFYK